MNSRNRIGTVLGDHDRLALLFPEIQFHIQCIAGGIQISGQIVPSVVTVKTNDIHRARHDIRLIIVLTTHERYRSVCRIQAVCILVQTMPVVVCRLWKMLGIRLISHGPHHYTRMIFVTCDHILYHLLMVL